VDINKQILMSKSRM